MGAPIISSPRDSIGYTCNSRGGFRGLNIIYSQRKEYWCPPKKLWNNYGAIKFFILAVITLIFLLYFGYRLFAYFLDCYRNIGKMTNFKKYRKLFCILGAPIIFSSTVLSIYKYLFLKSLLYIKSYNIISLSKSFNNVI